MATRRPMSEMSGLALLAGSALLVLLSVGGYLIGNLLDQRLNTAPTFAIIGLLFGVVIGFWDLFRIAAMVMRAQPSPPSSHDAPRELDEEPPADD
ncbi:MAG: putative F0F1-ATPase [bacterium ADurb.Bin429]|nr:MAG: putative F0F1-ATPase [bacterium ADurb.Bin429]